MIPHQYLFRALLLLSCGYALWRGRSDERIVALVCLGAVVATKFAISPITDRYSGVEFGLVLVDTGVLAAFVFVALRSPRFWPLWAAGLQLTSSLAHVMKAIDFRLVPEAYAAAAALWSYPILFILAIATWRGHQRRRRSEGPSEQLIAS
jgi:hypothetical protein